MKYHTRQIINVYTDASVDSGPAATHGRAAGAFLIIRNGKQTGRSFLTPENNYAFTEFLTFEMAITELYNQGIYRAYINAFTDCPSIPQIFRRGRTFTAKPFIVETVIRVLDMMAETESYLNFAWPDGERPKLTIDETDTDREFFRIVDKAARQTMKTGEVCHVG